MAIEALRAMIVLLSSGAPQCVHAAARLYVEADGWAYSEPVPIEAFADTWQAPLQGGSDAYAWLQIESGVRFDRWWFGWVLQRQYVIDANRAAARLYHLDRNDLPAPRGTTYDVSLRASFYSAKGFRIGRNVPGIRLGSWTLDVGPSLIVWKGDAFESGSLSGRAGTDDAGELSFDAVLSHAYSEDVLLARPVEEPAGKGASLDIAAAVTYGDKWTGRIEIHNLLGRMWWKNAPFTVGSLRSDNRQTDDSGAVNFDPTLSGLEGNRSHRQRLPLYGQLRARRVLGAYGVGVNLAYTDIGAFPGITWDHRLGGLQYGLDWLPTARQALNVHIAWGPIRLRVGGNAWDADELEQAQIQLGFEIPLGKR